MRPLPQWREKREFRFLLASQPPRSWGLTHVKKTGLPLAETLEETDPRTRKRGEVRQVTAGSWDEIK